MDNPVQEYEFLDLSDLGESELSQLRDVLSPQHQDIELPWSEDSQAAESADLGEGCLSAPPVDSGPCDWSPSPDAASAHISYAVATLPPHAPPHAFLTPPFYSSPWLQPVPTGEPINGGGQLDLPAELEAMSGDESVPAPLHSTAQLPPVSNMPVVVVATSASVRGEPHTPHTETSMMRGPPPARAFQPSGPPPSQQPDQQHAMYQNVYVNHPGVAYSHPMHGYPHGVSNYPMMQEVPPQQPPREQQPRGRGRKSMNKSRDMSHSHGQDMMAHGHPMQMVEGYPQSPPYYYQQYYPMQPGQPIYLPPHHQGQFYLMEYPPPPHPSMTMPMKPEGPGPVPMTHQSAPSVPKVPIVTQPSYPTPAPAQVQAAAPVPVPVPVPVPAATAPVIPPIVAPTLAAPTMPLAVAPQVSLTTLPAPPTQTAPLQPVTNFVPKEKKSDPPSVESEVVNSQPTVVRNEPLKTSDKPAMSGPPASAVAVGHPANQKKSVVAPKAVAVSGAAADEKGAPLPVSVNAAKPPAQAVQSTPVAAVNAIPVTPVVAAAAPMPQPAAPTPTASPLPTPVVDASVAPKPVSSGVPVPVNSTSEQANAQLSVTVTLPPTPSAPASASTTPSSQSASSPPGAPPQVSDTSMKTQDGPPVVQTQSTAPQWGAGKQPLSWAAKLFSKGDQMNQLYSTSPSGPAGPAGPGTGTGLAGSTNTSAPGSSPVQGYRPYDNQKSAPADGPQPVVPSTQTGWGQLQPPRTSLSSIPSGPAPALPLPNPANDPALYRLAEFLHQYKLDHKAVSLKPRGLTNRSNWCYINATLQALLACPPFYNLVRVLPVYPNNRSPADSRTPIIDSMKQFVEEFSPLGTFARLKRSDRAARSKDGEAAPADVVTDPSFEPNYVYRMLSAIRSDTLVEGRQEDAEEFLSVLLNGLNDEMLEVMKLAPELTNGDLASNGELEMMSQGDDDEWKVMGPKNKGSITRRADFGRTPLSDIFRGQLRSRVVRHNALDNITDNVQPFFTLQLDIEKVTSVKKALEQFVQRDQLEGLTCARSNQEVQAWQEVQLEELPPVLLLHLKWFDYRSDGCSKICKPVTYDIDLKIEPKLLSSKKSRTPNQQHYKLFAVVYHDGKEATKGHYVTDAYHVGYGAWIRYDDSNVKVVTQAQVMAPKAPRVPYLLYYRRQDTIVGH